MKIGFFFTNFPTKKEVEKGKVSFGGGEGVAVYNLALTIGEKGNEVNVFSASNDSDNRNETYLSNLTVYYYSSIFNIANAHFSLLGFLKPLKHDLHIINCHCPSPAMDFASILYKILKRKPLVVTYHSEPSAYGYGSTIRRIGFRLYRRLSGILLSEADVIISPSQYFIRESRLKNHKNKVVVIPWGIDLKNIEIDQSKRDCRKQLNLPIGKKIVFFLNALLPQKGPDVLIKGMAKVIERVPEAYLVLGGKGAMRKELEEMAVKEGIRRHVKFTGFITEGPKPFFYKASDLFVLPSTRKHESFGIVNLEAMASGLPIVASRIGGVPDVVKDGENGLLVPPKDSDALAEAIIYLLENEEVRRKMGEKGREMVKDYTWEKVAGRTEEVYKELLNKNVSKL